MRKVGTVEELQGDLSRAEEVYRGLCLNSKDVGACNRMRKLVTARHSPEEQKNIYRELCVNRQEEGVLQVEANR